MNFYRAIALALFLPLLAACATGGGARAPLTDEQQLSTRPLQRWQHLIAGEGEQAWEYLSPGYRATRDKFEYVGEVTNRPVRWLSVEPHSVNCLEEGKFCEVNLKVHFSVRSRQIGVGELRSHSFVTERWIKSGDLWFHVPEDVSG
jgi:hypothetical protein